MLTVSITVNGKPVYSRSGRNISNGGDTYLLDTGEEIKHNPDDGIIPLAIKMLETIKEV
jgi:hypothetical protein